MTIQEIRIGDKVKDRNGFEFEVVALFKDGTVYCDLEGNEGDVWEFNVDELERVVNDVVGRSEQLICECKDEWIEHIDNFSDRMRCKKCGKNF